MNAPAQPTAKTPGTGASAPAQASPPLMHEADIGSGEKTPAQEETEEMIRQIPPLPSDKDRPAPEGTQQQQRQQQQQ